MVEWLICLRSFMRSEEDLSLRHWSSVEDVKKEDVEGFMYSVVSSW